MKEIWKTIYINDEPTQYEISNLGRIKSLKFNKEKILKPSDNNGYLYVSLFYNKLQYGISIHRLVAEYFLSNFDKSLEVNHKDFNKKNNLIANLEMVTRQENAHHKKLAKRKYNRKKGYTLNEEQVRNIRKRELKLREYAEKYSVNLSMIARVVYYRSYEWVK
jgi:hypothetical protein